MTKLFDSTVYEFPTVTIFPRTSRLDEITIVSFTRPISESSRKFPAPTIGILFSVSPSMEISPPTLMLDVVTRPVVAFSNSTVPEVALPFVIISSRLEAKFERNEPSPMKRDA